MESGMTATAYHPSIKHPADLRGRLSQGGIDTALFAAAQDLTIYEPKVDNYFSDTGEIICCIQILSILIYNSQTYLSATIMQTPKTSIPKETTQLPYSTGQLIVIALAQISTNDKYIGLAILAVSMFITLPMLAFGALPFIFWFIFLYMCHMGVSRLAMHNVKTKDKNKDLDA